MVMKRLRQQGFTLLELMIVLGLMAILLGVAVPSYRTFQASQQVRSASAGLLASLNQARSEAVKRAANVTLTAATGGWNNGWLVQAGVSTLGSSVALAGATITGPASPLTYRRDGRTDVVFPPNKTKVIIFTVAPAEADITANRYLCMYLGGKPKVVSKLISGECP
jgi:type IV fimbrial biogenesis protein FimT